MSSQPLVDLTPGICSPALPSSKSTCRNWFYFAVALCKHPQFCHVVEVMTQLHKKQREYKVINPDTQEKKPSAKGWIPTPLMGCKAGKTQQNCAECEWGAPAASPHGSAHPFPAPLCTGCNQWRVQYFLPFFPFSKWLKFLSTSICCLCSKLNVGKSHQ